LLEVFPGLLEVFPGLLEVFPGLLEVFPGFLELRKKADGTTYTASFSMVKVNE